MMRMNPSEQHLEQGPVTIRALRSLTQVHADAVRTAVGAISSGWSVEQYDDYDGYLLTVVAPTTTRGDDLTFVVSGTVNQIELAEIRDDLLTQLGRFSTIEAASAGLAELLLNADRQSGA